MQITLAYCGKFHSAALAPFPVKPNNVVLTTDKETLHGYLSCIIQPQIKGQTLNIKSKIVRNEEKYKNIIEKVKNKI